MFFFKPISALLTVHDSKVQARLPHVAKHFGQGFKVAFLPSDSNFDLIHVLASLK